MKKITKHYTKKYPGGEISNRILSRQKVKAIMKKNKVSKECQELFDFQVRKTHTDGYRAKDVHKWINGGW